LDRLDEGVKTAVEPAHDEIVPETGVTPSVAVNVLVVTVPQAIGSLNTADILVPTATPVAALAGVVDDTVGGVVSAAAAVVNVQT
jgi:hypothetical protein